MKRTRIKRTATRAAHDDQVEFYDDVHELERGLRIDEHGLNEALVEQPDMFYRVSKALAMEISRRDHAKQALADAEADADLAVRARAIAMEEKVTETEVKSRVRSDASVRTAIAEHLRLCETVGKLAALKEAFQQRSYALKELVGLYLANYYSASEHTATQGQLRSRFADDARRNMAAARREASSGE